MQRYGQIIKIKPEKIKEYKELHANPYDGVCAMIKACNIQNYSIYLYGRGQKHSRMVESYRSLSNFFRLCWSKMA